jgi:hypothetical protein
VDLASPNVQPFAFGTESSDVSEANQNARLNIYNLALSFL